MTTQPNGIPNDVEFAGTMSNAEVVAGSLGLTSKAQMNTNAGAKVGADPARNPLSVQGAANQTGAVAVDNQTATAGSAAIARHAPQNVPQGQ